MTSYDRAVHARFDDPGALSQRPRAATSRSGVEGSPGATATDRYVPLSADLAHRATLAPSMCPGWHRHRQRRYPYPGGAHRRPRSDPPGAPAIGRGDIRASVPRSAPATHGEQYKRYRRARRSVPRSAPADARRAVQEISAGAARPHRSHLRRASCALRTLASGLWGLRAEVGCPWYPGRGATGRANHRTQCSYRGAGCDAHHHQRGPTRPRAHAIGDRRADRPIARRGHAARGRPAGTRRAARVHRPQHGRPAHPVAWSSAPTRARAGGRCRRHQHRRRGRRPGRSHPGPRDAEAADVAAGPDVILGRVEQLFDEVSGSARPAGQLWGVGIGLPGPVEFGTGTRSARPSCPAGTATRCASASWAATTCRSGSTTT